MKINFFRCFNCGACASVCPLNLIDVYDKKIEVREGCTDCGMCVITCPVGAMKIEEK